MGCMDLFWDFVVFLLVFKRFGKFLEAALTRGLQRLLQVFSGGIQGGCRVFAWGLSSSNWTAVVGYVAQ